jgi:hypothetical protein
MNNERRNLQETILKLLGAVWEDEVAADLRQASDGELFQILDKIETQLRELQAPAIREAEAGLTDLFDDMADVPDWDEKTPEELTALVEELERQLSGQEERIGAWSGQAPSRKLLFKVHDSAKPRRDQSAARKRSRLSLPVKVPTRLSCEELEPRSPTSMVAASIATAVSAAASVLLSDRSAFGPALSTSWAIKGDHLMVTVQRTSWDLVRAKQSDSTLAKQTDTVPQTNSDSPALVVEAGTVLQTSADWASAEPGGACNYAMADLSGGLFADPVVDRLIDALVA